MRKPSVLYAAIALLSLFIWSCGESTENVQKPEDSVIVMIENDTTEDRPKADSVAPNSKVVDSLLKKPVTTPSNNPFGLKAGDHLLKSGVFDKEPLNTRMQIVLGDKFEDYKKFLATAKVLKKDTDGFLYTMGAESKGSPNQAFFLYQHEKDVLFLGFQKGKERMMLNDVKSRLFAPEVVDQWAERPLE